METEAATDKTLLNHMLGMEFSWGNVFTLLAILGSLFWFVLERAPRFVGLATQEVVHGNAQEIQNLQVSDSLQWEAITEDQIQGASRDTVIYELRRAIQDLGRSTRRMERNQCLMMVEVGIRDVRECRESGGQD